MSCVLASAWHQANLYICITYIIQPKILVICPLATCMHAYIHKHRHHLHDKAQKRHVCHDHIMHVPINQALNRKMCVWMQYNMAKIALDGRYICYLSIYICYWMRAIAKVNLSGTLKIEFDLYKFYQHSPSHATPYIPNALLHITY